MYVCMCMYQYTHTYAYEMDQTVLCCFRLFAVAQHYNNITRKTRTKKHSLSKRNQAASTKAGAIRHTK